ncbi:putative nicotinamide N-methyltransferase Nnt1 [Aspergillus lucknowensis]|uniref:Protein N-terminal and lysine N-methyltransferase EFM7 n=1 Tax=Aspergillus lucknowensis TaxID=176173 RepID=A0ABR4LS08_9EURO
MADDFDAGDMFKDPDGFYPPEKEPTFAEHQMLSGDIVRVRLVGSHPLYGNMLWNAGRISSEYIESNAPTLITGKDVLEIGAAAGVPSIVSAIMGARTVVMTDYPDPDLVNNMQRNADTSAALIPTDPPSSLYVTGYKWGSDVEPLLGYLPEESRTTGFDVLIMADVVYSYREHGNLVKTMQKTLKRERDAVALIIFTPYQPWLLPQTEKFFPLAEQGGFKVTKVFEKLVDKALFENDPGDERLRRTVFGYELRWADDQLL